MIIEQNIKLSEAIDRKLSLNEYYQKFNEFIKKSKRKDNTLQSILVKLIASIKNDDFGSFFQNLENFLKYIIKKEDELIQKEIELLEFKKKLEKIKIENEEVRKSLISQQEVLKRDKEHFYFELEEYRKIQSVVLGNSHMKNALFLFRLIKTYLKKTNTRMIRLKAKNFDVENLSVEKRERILKSGRDIIYTENASYVQSLINEIMSHLSALWSMVEKKRITLRENHITAYYKALGLLKILHFKLDPFDDQLDMKNKNTIELRRIYSGLETSLSILSALEEDEDSSSISISDIARSYNKFSIEQKMNLLSNLVGNDINLLVSVLADTEKRTLFDHLLKNNIALTPPQVLAEIDKWDNINQTYRPQFLNFLKTYLSEKELNEIAEKQINQMREIKESEKKTKTIKMGSSDNV